MQSEEFDNKVKEAADHHHPAYDEKAWGKMKDLLDKHLPQEKDDNSRIIFFLLLFLLLGTGAWFLITMPKANNKLMTQVKQADSKQSQNNKFNEKISTPDKNEDKNVQADNIRKKEITTVSVATDNYSRQPVASSSAKAVLSVTVSNETADNTKTIFKTKPDKINKISAVAITRNGKSKKPVFKKTVNKIQQRDKIPDASEYPVTAYDSEKTTVTDLFAAVAPITTNNSSIPANNSLKKDSSNSGINKTITNEVVTKNDEAVVEKSKLKKVKTKKDNIIFFTVSAGPDISFAGSDKLGKVKLLAGAGIGYTFRNRITIRTGFYTGRKIYAASAAEYHPPADFYTYYPYLQKVDADCKVYEIPLSVNYNFGKSLKQNWFVSTGLSSYLMKSETYDYFYKYTATGNTMYKKKIIEEENKHYFSVLTLSGGYQRNINKHLSILVEPYVKLPLVGVGYGKVKLNSAGILFSVGIKPFTGSKK